MDRRRFLASLVAAGVAAGVPLPVGLSASTTWVETEAIDLTPHVERWVWDFRGPNGELMVNGILRQKRSTDT